MHLDDPILDSYIDGELAEPWKSQIEEHLSYCVPCKSRYNNLLKLSQTIREAGLSEQEIKPHEDRVLAMIEKNYLSKPKKESFFKRKLRMSIPQFMGIAAAFVVVFVGSWVVLGNNNKNAIPMPSLDSTIDLNNITPVRATDNSATSKSLDNYSLEDILKSLDSRGYDVDIKLRSIQPISLDKIEAPIEEVKILLTLENGTIISSNGVVTDQNGVVLATGVTLNKEEGTVIASDGTILFQNLKIN